MVSWHGVARGCCVTHEGDHIGRLGGQTMGQLIAVLDQVADVDVAVELFQ